MNAVDDAIPEPVRELEKPYLMPVEDVFSITGRGTVVTGRIERGKVHTGETVDIIGIKEKATTTTVTGVEKFRILDEGHTGRQRRACCSAGSSARTLSAARSSSSRAPTPRTPSSRVRSTSCPRRRAAATRRSSTTTVRSSPSVPPT